jgi:hypothetical protein
LAIGVLQQRIQVDSGVQENACETRFNGRYGFVLKLKLKQIVDSFKDFVKCGGDFLVVGHSFFEEDFSRGSYVLAEKARLGKMTDVLNGVEAAKDFHLEPFSRERRSDVEEVQRAPQCAQRRLTFISASGDLSVMSGVWMDLIEGFGRSSWESSHEQLCLKIKRMWTFSYE